MESERISDVVLSICALHNLLRSKSTTRNIITPAGSLDLEDTVTGEIVPGSWRENQPNLLVGLETVPGQRATVGAIKNRDLYMEYFNTVGSVPWQEKVLKI